MKIPGGAYLLFLSLTLGLIHGESTHSPVDPRVYIVYMRSHRANGTESHDESLHLRLLEEVVGSRATHSLVASYKNFNAFAAKLTSKEVQDVTGIKGVVAVVPSLTRHLHTTRSWNFLGFPQTVEHSAYESDVIVGVLDTGLWPESESFNDKGFGPPPSKWTGSCDHPDFKCNNKVIGGRYYRKDGNFTGDKYKSPRDSQGHGTHTASTAAGSVVEMVNMKGLGTGTARGGVPSARIAVYKVCWHNCKDEDILQAFDDAISDGVDIINVSLGGDGVSHQPYYLDSIAVGAFHALKKGILTCASAGNEGPVPGRISNIAPWLLTVAASTTDRGFVTNVVLGDQTTYKGVSLNIFEMKDKYPLIYGEDASNTAGGFNASSSRICGTGSLNRDAVHGKIVLCEGAPNRKEALAAGAGGIIMQGSVGDTPYLYPLPVSSVSDEDGENILKYMNSTRNATATILKSVEVLDKLAPVVSSFSSRGPNPITKEILKPNIAAPGVAIIAAWPENVSPPQVSGDPPIIKYKILSGTSMACPHVSGAASYIKSFHSTWSPAAISSALSTTAVPMNKKMNPEGELAYGAGNVNPLKAVNPGLIYNISETDYIRFVCGQGYNNDQLRHLTNDKSSCSRFKKATAWELNLPSFAVPVALSKFFYFTFRRTVTNVGAPDSSYTAELTMSPEDAQNTDIKINVAPTVLLFRGVADQKLQFDLEVRGTLKKDKSISASLIWVQNGGPSRVRSPIIIFPSRMEE